MIFALDTKHNKIKNEIACLSICKDVYFKDLTWGAFRIEDTYKL